MGMNIVYVASTITIIITALAISSTLLAATSAWATIQQKKNIKCDPTGELHTRNWCDGFYIGGGDCKDGHDNRVYADDSSHTKNWRDGYMIGWFDAGC